MRVQGAGPRLPQPLVPAEEGGSTCPCPGGGAACHQVPPGSPGVVALPAWLSAFRDQCAPRASPCPWAGLRPASPSAHPPSSHPHPWVLSLAPRMCSNPQPRGVPGRAHHQACAHCGCESSCATHPPPCPRTPARLPGGCFRFSNKGSVLCPLGSSDCRHIAAQPPCTSSDGHTLSTDPRGAPSQRCLAEEKGLPTDLGGCRVSVQEGRPSSPPP